MKEEDDNLAFDVSKILRYDFTNFGLFGNAAGYVITLTVLGFAFFKRPAFTTVT